MKKCLMCVAIVTTLSLAASPALAVDEKSEITSEKRKIEVDAQSGEVIDQKNVQKDTHQNSKTAAGSKTEHEHHSKGSSTAEGLDGSKASVEAQGSTKSSVTAEPDGDVTVEQKSERTEHKTTK